MSDPANVAAFARWLETMELGDYSPYAMPPKGNAKAEMVELSRSDIDRAFDEAVDMLPGAVLLPDQIFNAMREVARLNGYDLAHERWKTVARKLIQRNLFKISPQDGPNSKVKFSGRKHRTYARTKALAEFWSSSDDIRAEILKNGDPATDTSPVSMLRRPTLVVGKSGPVADAQQSPMARRDGT
jgi:hypothetical protein